MADRTVTARLRLVHSEYTKGAREAANSTKGIADAADQATKRTNGSWQLLGKATADLGDSMTARVTLPIVGLGGAAVKMAMDFNGAFDQMTALAGVGADEIDGLKESVLGLSEETGRAPQELAQALYFIRGAGLSGQTALDALDVSARAAAAGLGTTEEVANAVTNVINAYGAANISAAEAGDILTASVTAAKVEASEMAPQFGRLLPVASELGVGFDDVAGALAFLTVSSGDASQASTGLSGVLSKLLNPSQQGAAALEQIGLKAHDLRAMLGEKGLDGTIIELRKRMGDAGFRKLLDDSEALKAGLQMTGAATEQFQDIMDQTGDSAGALDQAFKKTDNDTRKMQITWAKAQGAMIRFGDAILPIITILADLASAAVGFLGDMPEGLRTVIVLFGALLAAAGPLLSTWGRMTQRLAEFSKWLETSSVAQGRFGDQVSKLPAVAKAAANALAAVGVALAAIEVIAGQRESRTRGWVEDIVGDPQKLSDVRSSIQEVKDELDELDDQEGKHRLFSVGSVNVFATGGDADRQERIDQLRERLGELEAQEESLVGQEGETAAAYVGTDNALAGLNEETSNAVNALQEYADALKAQMDPLFGMIDALDSNHDAQAAVVEAQEKLNVAIRDHGPASDEARAAQEALTDAQRDAARSALDVTSAAAQLTAGIEAGTVSLSDAKAQLAVWQEQGLLAGGVAETLAGQFDAAALKAIALGRSDPNVNVTTSGVGAVNAALNDLSVRIQQLDGSTITIDANVRHTTSTGRMGGVPLFHTGGVVPGRRGEEVAAILQAGERVLSLDDPLNKALSSPMASAAALGGGRGDVYVSVDMRGAVVGDERQFNRMVTKAWNRSVRTTRGVNDRAAA